MDVIPTALTSSPPCLPVSTMMGVDRSPVDGRAMIDVGVGVTNRIGAWLGSVHVTFGVGPKVKSWTPAPKKKWLYLMEFAVPA